MSVSKERRPQTSPDAGIYGCFLALKKLLSPASLTQIFLLVNFVGSRISSTEKGVLLLRGNLAASGCISALTRPTETQVLSVLRSSEGFYRQPPHTPLERFANLHVIQKVTQMKRCASQEQSHFACFLRRHADTLRPRGTPACALQNVNARSQLGVTELGYLLLGIWLKCAPFHSPRVSYCTLACQYLQMWDFTVAGHVNAGCNANWWTYQRESLHFLSLPPAVSIQPFVLSSATSTQSTSV